MLLLFLSYIENEPDKCQFENMYHSYKKQMLSYAEGILKAQDTAEDAVHNVFLNIARKSWPTVREIQNETDLRNYLLKATKNSCLNTIKIHNRERLSLDDIPEESLYSKADLASEDFVSLISDKIEYEQVVEAVKSLSDTYKNALYYHLVMELPVAKTARLLGQSVSTTQKQLVRGKKQLLSLLNGGR